MCDLLLHLDCLVFAIPLSLEQKSSNMSGNCTENHHYSHPLFITKRTHQEINLPPRKLLLTRHSNLLPISNSDDFLTENPNSPETPKFSHKFLPYNATEEDEDEEEDELADPYSSDDFRIYEFKVRRCMRSRSHDWTDCPFAHPGEKARRRDPRKFHYSGNSCSDFRRGSCPRGDSCEFSHGVFECWLHPARYRTQACKDGRNCKRKICFFAHTPNQLRVLPSNLMTTTSSPSHHHHHHHHHQQNCCVHCINSSPTSTLMGFSHLSSSPPLSPSTSEDLLLSYKNRLLMDLVNSLEAMDLSSASPIVSPNYYENQDHQTQFVLSPCTSMSKTAGFRDTLNEEDGLSNNGGGAAACPDLDWVNELVM